MLFPLMRRMPVLRFANQMSVPTSQTLPKISVVRPESSLSSVKRARWSRFNPPPAVDTQMLPSSSSKRSLTRGCDVWSAEIVPASQRKTPCVRVPIQSERSRDSKSALGGVSPAQGTGSETVLILPASNFKSRFAVATHSPPLFDSEIEHGSEPKSSSRLKRPPSYRSTPAPRERYTPPSLVRAKLPGHAIGIPSGAGKVSI
jgi:hypothetical protein